MAEEKTLVWKSRKEWIRQARCNEKGREIWSIQNRRYERRRKKFSEAGDGCSWDGCKILGGEKKKNV